MHDIRPDVPEPFILPGTVLYIGYRMDACAWLQELYDAGNEISVLEVYAPNLLDAAGKDTRVRQWWLGDVRTTAQVLGSWDYIWWWHGPEHIPKADWRGTLETLLGKTRRLLVAAAPWGRYPQGPHGGNHYEIHQWSVYEKDFMEAGMKIKTDGQVDQPGGEIVGWVKA